MRRIRKAKIEFISLVPKGANKMAVVYKSDGSVSFETIIKASDAFDDAGELTAVVYAPEQRDSQGDIASAEVVKQMAHDFIANGGKVDIKHDGKSVPAEKARVAETFLVQKTDTRFHGWKDRDGNAVDLEGAWATVIKIEDPELRKKYRSGEWAGVSMGGTAIVDQEKADVDRLIEAISKMVNHPPEETKMNAEEIKKAISDGFAGLTTALATELAKAFPKKEEPKPVDKADDAPKFTGKIDNERDLELHARKIHLHQLKKGTDFNDPESVRSYLAAVKISKQEWAEQDEAAGISATPTSDTPAPARRVQNTQLSKLDQDLLEAGRLVGEQFNAKNGKKGVA